MVALTKDLWSQNVPALLNTWRNNQQLVTVLILVYTQVTSNITNRYCFTVDTHNMEYFLLELIHKSFVDDKYTPDALNEVFPFVTIMIHI